MSSKGKRRLNLVFVWVPKNIRDYINLDCATVCFSISSLSVSLSLFQVPTVGFLCVRAWPPYSHSQLVVVWLQAKLTGWLHEKTASFRNSTHCTVWTRQLLSVKDKQTDRERRQREREEERGEKNVGDMKICEGAREQESKAEPVKNAAVSFFFFIALLWQHVWNWDVIRC